MAHTAIFISNMQESTSVDTSTSLPLKRDSDVGAGVGIGKMKIGNKTKTNSTTNISLAHAIIPELPVLMHGSGDVRPEHVHPHSVAILARLVEKYVASLVCAALDAHDIFTDGQVVGGGACLGPPPFRSAMDGGQVVEGGEEESSNYDDEENHVIDEGTKKRREKNKSVARKKKAKIDYWDVPLPPPPLQQTSLSSAGGGDNTADLSQYSNDDQNDTDEDDELPLLSPFRRNSSSSTTTSSSMGSSSQGNNKCVTPLVRGFAPVDLHANERSRNYYVAASTVMDARSFIFPICHDAVLYQRIKEVQASRRAIQRDVVDNVLLDVMREEGAKEGRRGLVDAWDAVLGSRASNFEGSKSSTSGSATSSTVSPGKKKKGDNTSVGTKENKKLNSRNAENLLVGAGLLDSDVDPSWPGLNALSRGRFW